MGNPLHRPHPPGMGQHAAAPFALPNDRLSPCFLSFCSSREACGRRAGESLQPPGSWTPPIHRHRNSTQLTTAPLPTVCGVAPCLHDHGPPPSSGEAAIITVPPLAAPRRKLLTFRNFLTKSRLPAKVREFRQRECRSHG